MIIQIPLMPCVNVLDPVAKNVNITTSSSIQEDGVEIARPQVVSTFQPGEIQAVIDFIGNDTDPCIAYLTAIWSE